MDTASININTFEQIGFHSSQTELSRCCVCDCNLLHTVGCFSPRPESRHTRARSVNTKCKHHEMICVSQARHNIHSHPHTHTHTLREFVAVLRRIKKGELPGEVSNARAIFVEGGVGSTDNMVGNI